MNLGLKRFHPPATLMEKVYPCWIADNLSVIYVWWGLFGNKYYGNCGWKKYELKNTNLRSFFNLPFLWGKGNCKTIKIKMPALVTCFLPKMELPFCLFVSWVLTWAFFFAGGVFSTILYWSWKPEKNGYLIFLQQQQCKLALLCGMNVYDHAQH